MHMKNYANIYYQPGDSAVFCYRSKFLVFEETFGGGFLAAAGCNTAGFPLNVLTNCPSRTDTGRMREPSSFNLEINGRNVDNAWELENFEDIGSDEGREGVITLKNGVFDVTVKIHTILDGTQMLSRYMEITNDGAVPLCISRLSLLAGAIENKSDSVGDNSKDLDGIYSVGYFDVDTWGAEGNLKWHPLGGDSLSFDTKFERMRFRHPAMFIHNRELGTMFFVQVAWSGGLRFSVDLNRTFNCTLSARIELAGYNPLYVLTPGETLSTPEICFGAVTGGLDEAVNEMNAHIRRTVLAKPEADGSRLLVGAGMGAEHDMSVETTKAFMRQMKEMGAEIFIIDGGWECPPNEEMGWYDHNGKNVPDSDRYPNGLKELREYASSIGMGFAMWMEPERLGRKSEMYKNHPDWFPTHFRGGRNDGFIDLTIPEAAKWVEDEIARVIEEYELDLFRLDHNGDPDYFCMRDVNGTGIAECTGIRHMNAMYRIFANLKKRFPNVIFENCASGGGRTDLGMMKSFNHTWVSDWQRLPRSVLITSGMTLVLPPERVDRLFAGMGSHEVGSLALNMRNTMLGHMSLNVISPMTAGINPDAMEFVKHSVSVYKEFIRPFIPSCSVYHFNPEWRKACDESWSALEIVAEDRGRAAMTVSALTAAAKDEYRIFPKGLDRSGAYRVTLDNTGDTFAMTGNEIENCGLRLVIPSPLMSELVLFERI